MSNKHIVRVNALTKEEAKDIKRALRFAGKSPTVENVRKIVAPGNLMLLIYIAATFAVLAGLSAIFLPLIIVAIVSPAIVIYKVKQSRTRWGQLLPESANKKIVELV